MSTYGDGVPPYPLSIAALPTLSGAPPGTSGRSSRFRDQPFDVVGAPVDLAFEVQRPLDICRHFDAWNVAGFVGIRKSGQSWYVDESVPQQAA
jgi:hypothetical protein